VQKLAKPAEGATAPRDVFYRLLDVLEANVIRDLFNALMDVGQIAFVTPSNKYHQMVN